MGTPPRAPERPVRPVYKSKTCEVYFAVDVRDGDAPVCLKIVWDPENFEGERASRSAGVLSPDHVVEVLAYVTPEDGVMDVVDEQAAAGGGDTDSKQNGETSKQIGAPPSTSARSAPPASESSTTKNTSVTGAPTWRQRLLPFLLFRCHHG